MGDDIDIPERLQEILSDPHYNLILGSAPSEAVKRGVELLRAPLPCKVNSILETRSCVNQPTSVSLTRTFTHITSPEDAAYIDNIKGFIIHFTSIIACAVRDSRTAQSHVDCLVAMLLRAAIPSADIMTSCLFALPPYRDTSVHRQPCYSVADFFVREAAPDDESSGEESVIVVEDACEYQSGSDSSMAPDYDDMSASEHSPEDYSGGPEEYSDELEEYSDEPEEYSDEPEEYSDEPEEYSYEPEEMLNPDDPSETTTSESLGPPPGSEDQILFPSTKQEQRPAIFCATRLISMPSLLASATYHRAVVGAAGPLVSLAIDDSDSVAYVLFSNVEDQTETELPAIHVYTDSLARFDLTIPADIMRLGLFLRRWEECRPRCPPQPKPMLHLRWRADIAVHSSPRKKDIDVAFASADNTFNTVEMIRKWTEQVHTEINTLPHSIVSNESPYLCNHFAMSNQDQTKNSEVVSSSKNSETGSKRSELSQTNLSASLYAKRPSGQANAYVYWHGILRVLGNPYSYSQSQQDEVAKMPRTLLRSLCPHRLEITNDMPKSLCNETNGVLATLIDAFDESHANQFLSSMPPGVNDIVIESMCGIVHAVNAALAVGPPSTNDDHARARNEAEFRAPWDALVEAVTKSALLEYSREATLHYFKRGLLQSTGDDPRMRWSPKMNALKILNARYEDNLYETHIPLPLADNSPYGGEKLEPVSGRSDAIIALPLAIRSDSKSGNDLYKRKNIWRPSAVQRTEPEKDPHPPTSATGTGFNVRYGPTPPKELRELRQYLNLKDDNEDPTPEPLVGAMAELAVSESSPPSTSSPGVHSHSAAASPDADVPPGSPHVEESSGGSTTQQKKQVLAFILNLIVLVVEHKKILANKEEEDAVAQCRMALAAAIQHLAVFNIGHLPVASLTTNGCLGRLSGGWFQRQVIGPTVPGDPTISFCVGFIADWDSVTYDIRRPDHAVHVAAFVAQQALHTQVILQKLFKEVDTVAELEDDVKQYLLDPEETQSPWALACRKDIDLHFMEPFKLSKAAAEEIKKNELDAMNKLKREEQEASLAQQAASHAEGGQASSSQKAGRHTKPKNPKQRPVATQPSIPEVDEK
ncbi:hypothetical protein CYLTODRAFT_487708 [Cylindrobasidium torrendii FP15055 ss-10]|uniref:Uncharacterized protein n=1 Tax=Cylindrobasidium torrendii FP15055 ss-10 TaxID=1314674 RepID=A0A0D7BL14_9AGAR|nr:hypothetical protein CYLTODRAFT_487708 [Cylindrobasidium torrendii FP15055 ss-10]